MDDTTWIELHSEECEVHFDLTEEELNFCQTMRYSERIDRLEKRKEGVGINARS